MKGCAELNDELKTCCRCKRELPKTLEYFGKDKRKKSGLNYACRECCGGHFTKQAKEGYKICSGCGKEFPATKDYFHAKSSGTYGLSGKCKECKNRESKEYKENNKTKVTAYHKKHYQETKETHKEKQREWTKNWREQNKCQIKIQRKKFREENKEKISEYAKKYHLEHREQNKLKCKEYSQKNKEYIADQRKGHYQDHREENRERNKLWMKNNKDKVNEIRQRRRAAKLSLANDYTKAEWNECKDIFNHCCAYCGKPSKRLTQDHFIPLSKGGGYVAGNIIPACQSCNSSKKDKYFFIWYPKQLIYSKERETAILCYLDIYALLAPIGVINPS